MKTRIAFLVGLALVCALVANDAGAELAAGSVTAAKIQTGTITATQIATSTITADRMNVTTLSSIAANVGTLTGGTIDGVTVVAGSGDEVTLDSSGVTLSAGTGSNNSVKWSDGSAIRSASDQLNLISDTSVFLLTNFINLNADTEVDGNLRVNTLGGGGNRYVCADNDGDLSAGGSCGPAPEPAAMAVLREEIAELRAEVARLVAAAQSR
jgi:hypothetical protein